MAEDRGEFAYIDWIRARLPREADDRVTVGPGDDMAEVVAGHASGGRVLVGTDTILDGVHFDRRRDRLADVGWKALAVNLSDVAAMAAEPLAAVGAVTLPRELSRKDAEQLFAGLQRCAETFACRWVGGDVTAWDHPLAITVTVLAEAEHPVLRGGARPGQLLFVTGALGGSLLGRHLTFTPRVREARLLARAVRLGAMIDLSDGLSSDVGHLCDESRVGVEIEAARVPVSDAAAEQARRDGRAPLRCALDDGEDFELLFTADPSAEATIAGLDLGVPVARIGRVVPPGEGRTLVLEDGRRQPLRPGGYEHWR